MAEKRLLAILSRYLWPVDGGRKESLNHYLRELHDQYGYKIIIMCFLEYGQQINRKDFPKYISDVLPLPDVSRTEKVKNIFQKTIGREKWPFQCSFYYSQSNRDQIYKMVKQWQPDVIFTEMIRTCCYYDAIKDSNALMISNLDDLLSKRYLRQVNSKRSKANIAGSYSDKLPKPIAAVLNNSGIKNVILRMESRRCAIWEKNYYEYYDYTLMTSDVERDNLNQLMGQNKAKTLSVGIDYDYYSADIDSNRDPIGLSYLGNFSVAANADTLDMIVNEILPLVKTPYHFYVIGKCPKHIQEKYVNNSDVIFCGRVDDLREYVKKASVFLAPIAYGTGVKTKIVEAMAMNMPVVTNSVGAEGICAEPGTDFFVSDVPQKIASAVDELLNDPDQAARMGKKAGIFAYNHFRWETILQVFQEMNL